MARKEITRKNVVDAVKSLAFTVQQEAENVVPKSVSRMSYDEPLTITMKLQHGIMPSFYVNSNFICAESGYELYKNSQIKERLNYQFPHLHKFDGLNKHDYVLKITEESYEVIQELDIDSPEYSDLLILEVLDVMQACETLLRNCGRTEDELIHIKEIHDIKDSERGYQEVNNESETTSDGQPFRLSTDTQLI